MAYIKLNLQNYAHNIELLAKKAGGIDKIAVVLKDNAYGHGLKIIAKKAKELGVKKAVVRKTKEGKKISSYFDEILVLSDYYSKNAPSNIVYALNDINSFDKFPKNSKLFFKINTGMNRNGLSLDQIKQALEIAKNKQIICLGAFTHFHSAGVVDSSYFVQKQEFELAKKMMKQYAVEFGFENLRFHSHNSDALLRRKEEFDEDFARVGIATYGYSGVDKSFGDFDLKPVMSLWANRMSRREIKQNESIGYGAKFIADKDMIASNYDIGYGDGFLRYNGKENLVLEGHKVLGVVAMDNICLECDEDEVCLFKDASYLANFFDTITYDILVKLNPKIKKVIVK